MNLADGADDSADDDDGGLRRSGKTWKQLSSVEQAVAFRRGPRRDFVQEPILAKKPSVQDVQCVQLH
jgi:hypothetical protein